MNPDNGALAEQFTATELKRLSKRGWHVASHVVLRVGDIDHVAIGPGGGLVIETKRWTNQGDLTRSFKNLRPELVRSKARDIRLMLKARLGEAPVWAVIVVWGPASLQAKLFEDSHEGVVVLSGSRLRSWLDSIGDADITPEVALDAWQTIKKTIQDRDAFDARNKPVAPSTLLYRMIEVFAALLTGFAMFIAAGDLLKWFPIFGYVVGTVLLLIGIGARQVSRARLVALGWLTGVVSSFLVVGGTYGYAWLAHR